MGGGGGGGEQETSDYLLVYFINESHNIHTSFNLSASMEIIPSQRLLRAMNSSGGGGGGEQETSDYLLCI